MDWLRPTRPRIFVSYHHHRDRAYYDEFSRFFSQTYEAIQDNSVEREIDSEDAEYVSRCIRENYITGTSCTVVLCGAATFERKFVDWEIKATLDKQHGLIGVNLPTNPNRTIPIRLYDNIQAGYAGWIDWTSLSVEALISHVALAASRSRSLIDNYRPMKSRNG